jgi:uncharacterized protein
MQSDNSVLTAIDKREFERAEQLLLAGEKIPADMHPFNLSQLYDQVVRAKAFGILNILIERKRIITDVYEYESFKDSIFESLFTDLPGDADSLLFLENFLEQLDNKNDEVEGFTLLSYALEEGASPAIIRTMISGGCATNFRNLAEETLVYQVVNNNRVSAEKRFAYLSILVEQGIDINEPNVEGTTALHLAVRRHKKEFIQPLLDYGADPTIADKKNETPFYTAIVDLNDGETYKQLSAKHRADFNLRNRSNETLLSGFMRMMYQSDGGFALLQQLIDDGADLKQCSPYYNEDKSGLDWLIEKDSSLLQAIVEKNNINVNEQDNEGNTMLHKICKKDCNYSQEAAKNTYRKVKFLLAAGADPSITNIHDETAMQLAAKDNLKAKTVELLLHSKK